MSTILLNVSPNQNFGNAIAVKDLSGIHVPNFFRCPPPQPKQSCAAPDSHPDITISHDEFIDIFAFSSARGLNFTL